MSRLINLARVGLVASAMLLSGCATTSENGVNDPFESYNRAMFKFNDVLDRAVVRPVARGYDTVVPEPISWGISNFFSNLNDITVAINSLLQGKFRQAGQDAGRFILNSTVGVAGIFDVATPAGYTKNNEDFGQTLGVWGFDTGPYIVLPFLGPSTGRDALGRIPDWYTDPVMHIDHTETRYVVIGTRVIDTRANLLQAESVMRQAATDEYAFVRDAYLQRRLYLVHDGNPPQDDYDIFDDDID
ncbi:MAG: VacJ family lipoprotein [Methylophaga sp.]|nr:VacJ family lipoprotein [Methylophaga sp.]